MAFNFHDLDTPVRWSKDNEGYCRERMAAREDWYPFLSFPVTKRCNFHCLYCGAGGEATASTCSDIPFDLVRTYVEYALSIGLKKIRITGGEPFLHPEIRRILEYLGSLDVFTLVNTNGSLVKRNADWLRTLPETVRFAVSFDSLRPETLKTISGVECHRQIREGLDFLSETGHLLRLNMVVNKHNIDEVDAIIDYCRHLSCDLKILDVVSVPVPFSSERQDFYREVSSLEERFARECDEVYSHEYSRGFGTPCFRYRFGNVFVTVKNSWKGSHYDICPEGGICRECRYFPCHEGLYDLFCLSDGRLCSCRWTEDQAFASWQEQMQWLIRIFKRSVFVPVGQNKDMQVRQDLSDRIKGRQA